MPPTAKASTTDGDDKDSYNSDNDSDNMYACIYVCM